MKTTNKNEMLHDPPAPRSSRAGTSPPARRCPRVPPRCSPRSTPPRAGAGSFYAIQHRGGTPWLVAPGIFVAVVGAVPWLRGPAVR